MNSRHAWASVMAVMLTAALQTTPAPAQTAGTEISSAPASADSGTLKARGWPAASGLAPGLFHERDLSGPRVGITMATDPNRRSDMQRNGLGAVVSQFGWHFEHQVTPAGNGPSLVTEMIPLFAGFEYGKLIPSLTMVVGVRSPGGLEFGMGPSFTLANARGRSATGLVVAAGRTIEYGGINIPFNVAVSTNPDGTRVSLIAGYAIQRIAR